MIVEISAVPIGVGESLSMYIAEVLKIIKQKGLRYQLTSMGTIIELNDFDELCNLLKEFDKKLTELGSKRNYNVIKIDSKKTTMENKVKSVLDKIK